MVVLAQSCAPWLGPLWGYKGGYCHWNCTGSFECMLHSHFIYFYNFLQKKLQPWFSLEKTTVCFISGDVWMTCINILKCILLKVAKKICKLRRVCTFSFSFDVTVIVLNGCKIVISLMYYSHKWKKRWFIHIYRFGQIRFINKKKVAFC